MCKGTGITVTVDVSVLGAAIARLHISDRVMKSNNAFIPKASYTDNYTSRREKRKPDTYRRPNSLSTL